METGSHEQLQARGSTIRLPPNDVPVGAENFQVEYPDAT